MSTTARQLDTGELEQRVKHMYEEVALEPERDFHFETGRPLAERLGYPVADLDRIPVDAIESFAGVGYFLDLAAIESGETVLDLGSGSGMDSFLAALATGSSGRVIGVDMTRPAARQSRTPRRRGRLLERRIPSGLHRASARRRWGGRLRDIERRDQPLTRQAGRVRRCRPGPPPRRAPGTGRHRQREAASGRRNLRRLALGGLHRWGHAVGRLPRGDRDRRIRDRDLAREQRLPLRLRAGR